MRNEAMRRLEPLVGTWRATMPTPGSSNVTPDGQVFPSTVREGPGGSEAGRAAW